MAEKRDTVKVVLKKSSLVPGAKNVDLNSLRQILARAQNKQRALSKLDTVPVKKVDAPQKPVAKKDSDTILKIPDAPSPKKTVVSVKDEPVSPVKKKEEESPNDDVLEPMDVGEQSPTSPRKTTESIGYSCCFCTYHSEDPESYRKHIASHIRNKALRCNLCSFSTDKITAYNEHVRTTHKKVPPIKTTYVCGVCDFKAFTSESLWKHKVSTNHKKFNDKISPIACRLCGHVEASVYKQAQHILSHSRSDFECERCDDPENADSEKGHSDECPEVVSPLAHQYEELLQKPGRKQFHCTLCDFESEQLLFLMEHIKAHSRNRASGDDGKELDSPFSCTMCEYRCVRPIKLVHHMKTHGPGTIFRCKDCFFESTDMNIFKAHWKRHSERVFYRCFVCLEQFPTSAGLSTHMISHTKGKPFSCEVCDFKCLTKNRLLLHMKSHAEPQKTLISFPCPLCKNKFPTHASLKTHLKIHKVTGESGDRPYHCDYCAYSCFTPEVLKVHLLKHSSSGGKFRCEICMLTFSTEGQLRGHVRDHVTYDKPVKCELCNTSFVSKAQLVKHMTIHSGKYPFVCVVCSTGFPDETSKRDHLLTVHDIQDEDDYRRSKSGIEIMETEVEEEREPNLADQPPVQFGYVEENVDSDSEDELAH